MRVSHDNIWFEVILLSLKNKKLELRGSDKLWKGISLISVVLEDPHFDIIYRRNIYYTILLTYYLLFVLLANDLRLNNNTP